MQREAQLQPLPSNPACDAMQASANKIVVLIMRGVYIHVQGDGTDRNVRPQVHGPCMSPQEHGVHRIASHCTHGGEDGG